MRIPTFVLALWLCLSVHAENITEVYPDTFDSLVLEVNSVVDFGRLSASQRIAYCILLLETEVNNGGFHQLFGNSSGYFVPDIIVALETIGADSTVALLKKAIFVAYPNGYPSDRTLYNEVLRDDDAVFEELDEFDTSFYRYEDNLEFLVNQYLRNDT